MNKSVWVILILGLVCMVALFYMSTNVFQSTPQLQRFFLIRNTMAEEYKIPKESFHLARDSEMRTQGVRIRLPDLDQRDSLALEDLAGRVFELEKEIRKEEGNPDVRYFRQVVFEQEGGPQLRLSEGSYRKRKEIRSSLGEGGRLREDLGEALGLEPASLELSCEEEGGRLSAPGVEIGVSLYLDAEGEEGGRPDRAAEAGEIAFGRLSGKIHFFRVVFRSNGSEQAFRASAKDYFEERRRARGPGGVRWEKVFKQE